MIETWLACLITAALAYGIGRASAHGKAYQEGFDAARGRRDEMIEKYKTMVEETIRQRDDARANRIVLPPPPNPFASKEWN